MRKIGDMMDHYNIEKMKQDSIYALLKDPHIQSFVKEYHIDPTIVEDYWVELLDYHDDKQLCQGCQSLENCPKDNHGMVKRLNYHDHEIVLELATCPYGKALEEKRTLLERFFTNVNEQLLLTDLKTLDIVKNVGNLSLQSQNALSHILKYIQVPSEKGLFLHDDMGQGTILLAGLMNALAKKEKEIGFIHFPTYLIDLKASFTSGDNEYAMERLMKIEYLFLDGIGEENITAWSRDEILLTVLSYRLLNHLPTFFTSIYGYKDLKKLYTIKKGDELRANTLLTKMKALSIEITLDEVKLK